MHRFLLAAALSVAAALASGNNYKNFDVAVYSRVYETKQMKDPAWLESHWEAISKYMKVDKIYLETHRDMVVVDQETLDQAKKFFLSKGVKVSGGITATINERNLFETYCYSDPDAAPEDERGGRIHRQQFRRDHPRRFLLYRLQVRRRN